MSDKIVPSRLQLAGRINLIVISTLVTGLGIVAFFFAFSLISTRESLSNDNLAREADILYASIENFMMPGEAPIAVRFFEDVQSIDTSYTIALYRRDGKTAFTDNQTIETVNTNLGLPRFMARPSGSSEAGPVEQSYFDSAIRIPPESMFFRAEEDGRVFSRVYRPLINLPKCAACHGGDHTIRGVIDVRTDITQLVAAQNLTIGASVGGFVLMVSLLAMVIGRFMRSVVVSPVLAIGQVCSNVTAGDFSGRVEVASRDEIGLLASTVNEMVQGLHERYELTKYVSAGTISSIEKGQETDRVDRTLLFSDVRGFTAYTEKHGAEAVVNVLNLLLESQSRIISALGGDIDKFVGDEIVAVFSGDKAPERACAAAARIQRMALVRSADFDGLAVGIGVATGMVIHGMVGSSQRADFTVIGDPVNIAARLCGMAKRGQSLVCDCTFGRISDSGTVVLKASSEAGAARAEDRVSARSGTIASDGFTFVGPYKANLKGKIEAQRVYLLAGIPGTMMGADDGTA
ncbi:MAG: adenylate/guanylate cyclase domain-containing protein [Clostridia bacterium]|jgi:class 3 adenylate cyclase